MGATPHPGRRAVLKAVLALGALPVAAACLPGSRPDLRLAAGERGGFFREFAALLSAAADRAGASVRIVPLGTEGSMDNLAAVSAGTADLALTLMDAADAPGAGDRWTAIGRVYENYLQVAVRADSAIESLADLRGTTVSVGAEGSGATATSGRVLEVAGLGADDAVHRVRHTMSEAAAALASGGIGAAMWAGGIPTPAFARLPVPLRLLDLGDAAAALRRRFGAGYETVDIAADTYGRHPGVRTVGVANLLVARADLPAADAAAVVDLLLDHAADLVPPQAVGSQFLDPQSLIVTGSVPLHPAAADRYRRRHG